MRRSAIDCALLSARRFFAADRGRRLRCGIIAGTPVDRKIKLPKAAWSPATQVHVVTSPESTTEQQARIKGPRDPIGTGTVMSVTGLEIMPLRREQFAAARQML